MSADVDRLVVVGAGLVGGSIALAAREAGIGQVVLTDTSSQVCARAAALGLAHRVVRDLAEAVVDAQVVIAAVPTFAVAAVLEAVAAAAPADAILTDAASLKAAVTVEVEQRLREGGHDPSRFVGGHPMAGSEHSGPDAADPQLFQGATWVLTPTSATADDVLARLSGLVRRLGARVVALPPERHDELVAIVSHLPQIAASALANVAADAVDTTGDTVLTVSGGGFRDTTRIAASDPELWIGILEGNREAVLDAVSRFSDGLRRVADALESRDWPALRVMLARASAARRRLVPKAAVEHVVDVVVPLDDRPGQLATATTALGEAGINIEDLAMRHAADGGRGALQVRVAATAAVAAVAVLAEAGLIAHIESPAHHDELAEVPAAGDHPGDHSGVVGTTPTNDTYESGTP